MIRGTFYRGAEGRLSGFWSRGHALPERMITSDETFDLICSAVSALTQTGVNALEAVAGITPVTVVRDGELRSKLPADVRTEEAERAETVLRTIRVGLEGIAQVYPGFVQIDEVTDS